MRCKKNLEQKSKIVQPLGSFCIKQNWTFSRKEIPGLSNTSRSKILIFFQRKPLNLENLETSHNQNILNVTIYSESYFKINSINIISRN